MNLIFITLEQPPMRQLSRKEAICLLWVVQLLKAPAMPLILSMDSIMDQILTPGSHRALVPELRCRVAELRLETGDRGLLNPSNERILHVGTYRCLQRLLRRKYKYRYEVKNISDVFLFFAQSGDAKLQQALATEFTKPRYGQ